nr:MAG TPA: hypothetical protein [Bacteriophage sp.]
MINMYYKIYKTEKYNNTTTDIYTAASINHIKKLLDKYPNSDFVIYKCEEITKDDVIREYYKQNSSDKFESCPSCWKNGEHNKEYNSINTSASIEV